MSTVREFPAEEAAKVIAEWMSANHAPGGWRVTVTALDYAGTHGVGGELFEATARIVSPAGEQFMTFRLWRRMARDGERVTVTSARH